MLDPSQRQLYVDALRPPTGYVLDQALATTYSLDLTTLLGIPLAIVMPHLDARRLGDQSAIELFQALRQASSRLLVFCDRAGIAAPSVNHVLYGMLEPVVLEVAAPAGGALHAKVWLLRFEPEESDGSEPFMRLVVLSRNLTNDRSWDVSVTLDGRITGRNRALNAPVAELFEALPGLCVRDAPETVKTRVSELVSELRRVEWELPAGFESLQFHLLGMNKKRARWLPERSQRLAVISPFVSTNALRELAATCDEPVAVISRFEELDAVAPDAIRAFASAFTLDEATERDDGEDTSEQATPTGLRGLHAKVYVAKRGWDTHLYLGSANATNAALLAGQNIEFMVELVGKTSSVPGKGIDGLLAKDGLGALLTPYTPAEAPPEVNAELEQAEQALRAASGTLAAAPLSLCFDAKGALYGATLLSTAPIPLAGVAEIRAWLVTTDASNARDVRSLITEGRAMLTPCSSESATGFVAFELVAALATVRTTFVLNLPVVNMPADREAQVVRVIVNNRDHFLKYLLSLLTGLDPNVRAGLGGGAEAGEGGWGGTASGAGLLERLVRTRARHPERLDELRVMVDALVTTPEGKAILSEEFLELWNVIEEVRP